ncbi:MAG TPA: ABC transporter ATP-binding protein [Trueperaceae bacterium]
MASIEVDGITKRYRKRNSKELVTAVDGVSFLVQPGEVLGLLGPNGAGKTTTIKTICGLLRPDSGRVRVCGVDNQRQRQKALRHISAVLEGNRNLYWRLTVRENLEYFAGNRGRSRRSTSADIERLLASFHLVEKAGELVNNLSRGMQQKLAIAVAMLAGTEVLLLDEPTLGLDVETGYEVREHLNRIAREEGRTILLSTHDMSVVQDLCERTVIVSDGKVVVDDKVGNLLKLFDTRAYTISLVGSLSARQRAALEAKFPALTIEDDGHNSSVRVDLRQSDEIYDLIEILRLERSHIDAIDRTPVDFEQVFRKLVGSNGRAAPAVDRPKEEAANA